MSKPEVKGKRQGTTPNLQGIHAGNSAAVERQWHVQKPQVDEAQHQDKSWEFTDNSAWLAARWLRLTAIY